MSTDQPTPHDEASQQSSVPARVVDSSPAPPTPEAAAGDIPTPPQPDAGTSAQLDAASSGPVSAEEANVEAPARKLQLRPTIGPNEARAVPNVSATAAPPAEAGSTPIPPVDDDEIATTVARSLQGFKPEDVTAPPAEPSEPVAVPAVEDLEATLASAVEEAFAAVQATADSTVGVATSDVENLKPKQKLQGVVVSIDKDSVFLDVGLRMTGVVPFRQFPPKKPPQPGDSVEVLFDKIAEDEGLILTNLPRGTSRIQGGDWDAVSPGQVVECVVTKTNKGGLEATVGSLRGFIPASQVEMGYVADLQTYVGQKLRVRVGEVNPAKRKLVLSRRSLLAEEREAARQELWEVIKTDEVRPGRVKSIKEYGAFIDLGGMDGFLPVAQMSWVRINHPSEVLTEGQEIEVKILSIDREKNRVTLGMRQLSPNPWRTVEDKYPKGSTVTGRVTRVEAFGAFIELEPGVEGLVHISELDHRRVKRVTEVLNVDDMVEVQVLELDPGKKRISLSSKALKAKPEPEEKPKDEDLAPGKGQVYERQRKEALKGGTGGPSKGGLFGNPQDFTR